MSFKFGIMDFFGYTLPGIVYLGMFFYFYAIYYPIEDLSVFNEFFKLSSFILFFMLAFLVGQIMQSFTGKIWGKFVKGREIRENEYHNLKRTNPNLEITFQPDQVFVLQAFIRKHNPEHVAEIAWFNALRIMMLNISFAFCLLFLFELQYFFFAGFPWLHLIVAILSLFFAYITFDRSKLYYRIVFKTVFETAAGFAVDIGNFVKHKPVQNS